MPYFDSKSRTVFSPQVDKLEPFYKILEQYHQAIGGSNLFDDLVETYEYLDYVFRDKEEMNNEPITTNRNDGSGRNPITRNTF
ncbi:hypothetical protein H9655_09030 [Cytobacillus sp. Sa5YUA1]|uniref:YozE SAM-like domain-containing protein n=1 Tax=Cytobacillus stercorigallinarum TaxID=2762240 RepID=A0ABR8QNQ7_9BACI|nr:hypothetical protein [Cytobacillus stercorigallinarum]MBD7937174.1 hypothetical protein [Cytobacillus stercorigallinarum]